MTLPLSLYVHWPFCEAKCPYCDFNSHVRERVDAKGFEAALLTELDYFSGQVGINPLTSVFFGGGTPSLMPPETVRAILEQAKDIFGFEDDIEITLEANPGSAEAQKFAAFKKAGVNRLSLGVQSFDDDALKFLGRVHDAAEARAALAMAKDIFPRISFDLIYARPGQREADWGRELETALAFARGHLSLYQLTLEKDTAFYRQHQRGELKMTYEGTAAKLYQLTNRLCAEAGLVPYEVSNYAAPDQAGRHNLNYWTGGQYIGIGPGAHGRYKGSANGGHWVATAAIKPPEAWLSGVEEQGHGIEATEEIGQHERAEEMVLTGLRLFVGIAKDVFAARAGLPLFDVIDHGRFQALRDDDLTFETDTRAGLTQRGMLFLDQLVAELV